MSAVPDRLTQPNHEPVRDPDPPAERAVVVVPVRRAASPWSRLRGLLAGPMPPAGEGLLLTRCIAVHTVGMTRPIDVVFVDRHGRILAMFPALGSARVAICRRAADAVEFAAGDAARYGLAVGVRIRFVVEGATA
jgi:uncharacterized membrane protein (UPF0127 family)